METRHWRSNWRWHFNLFSLFSSCKVCFEWLCTLFWDREGRLPKKVILDMWGCFVPQPLDTWEFCLSDTQSTWHYFYGCLLLLFSFELRYGIFGLAHFDELRALESPIKAAHITFVNQTWKFGLCPIGITSKRLLLQWQRVLFRPMKVNTYIFNVLKKSESSYIG